MADPPRAPETAPDPVDLPAGYTDLGVLARGAMGEVRRVRELGLDQVLAMKICRTGVDDGQRFQTEARAMARLRHPGILAVHDQGELADGRRWFTTREVVGRTLAETIRELHGAAGTGEEGFLGVVEHIAAAAAAVGFAHDHGVFHRDLKPENIMVGAYGEVVVVDWGLSTLSLRVDAEPAGGDLEGSVLGTPAYMSPEQAAGLADADHARSDVFGLGACLFELLHARAPYPQAGAAALRAARAGAPSVPPLGPGTPAEVDGLIATCRRAMAADPRERPSDGNELASELRAALATRARRTRALALVRQAARDEPAILDALDEIEHLRHAATTHLAGLGPRAPTEEKARGWELEDRAAELELEANALEARYLQRLRAALHEDENLLEAHALLATRYRAKMARAEDEGRLRDAAFCEVMLRSHDRAGHHHAWLDGRGTVTLVVEPGDATVELFRFVCKHRRLEAVHLQRLPAAAVREHELERGSYLAIIRRAGCAPLRVPFVIRRGEAWPTSAPGERRCQPFRLRPHGADPDTCVVPEGWFVCGGDPESVDAFPRRRVWVDAFAIATFPVTFGEYLAFVQDVDARGGDPAPLLPAETTGVSGVPRALVVRDERGVLALGAGSDGRPLVPDLPAVLVDWHQASAYAAWLAERTGRPWRLLDELEWEKAARGVDGRAYPWGDFLDPTWTCMLQSHDGPANSVSVRAYPTDVSPYGVRGMGGNVREWCLGDYRAEAPPEGGRVKPVAGTGEHRMIRGGSWSSGAHFCRIACRFAMPPSQRITSVGMRLGYSL